jgi:long-chain acyl-CoA synthetase
MSLLRPILKRALFHPRRVAVVDDFRQYTYAQLGLGALFVARAVEQATSNPRVGVILPTSGLFPMTLLGLWLARRVAVPLNYLLLQKELATVIADSGIDTLITVGPMLTHLGGEKNLPAGIKVLTLDSIKFKGIPPVRWPASFGDDEPAVILYTSGTSGDPKGVVLTHGNLHSDVAAGIKHAHLTEANAFLGVIPQFHSYGLTALTLIPLLLGAKIVYTARFVPRKLVDLIRTHRPDIMAAVPSMYGALLSVKDADAEAFKSVSTAISGGEALPANTFEKFKERFGVQLLEGYGLTETSPIIYWSTPDRFKRGAVGLPLPGVEPLIVDDNDKPALLDSTGGTVEGEILVSGPMIMAGYFNKPEATAQVIVNQPGRDGKTRRYFRTGDLGRIDGDGYLFITGRKKDVFKVAGEMVAPREIEECLSLHPSVRGAAVVPKADDVRGLVPVAFVEAHEGQTIDEAALRSWCRERLAGYKVPREVRVIAALPRNATGKILRRELKAD